MENFPSPHRLCYNFKKEENTLGKQSIKQTNINLSEFYN